MSRRRANREATGTDRESRALVREVKEGSVGGRGGKRKELRKRSHATGTGMTHTWPIYLLSATLWAVPEDHRTTGERCISEGSGENGTSVFCSSNQELRGRSACTIRKKIYSGCTHEPGEKRDNYGVLRAGGGDALFLRGGLQGGQRRVLVLGFIAIAKREAPREGSITGVHRTS